MNVLDFQLIAAAFSHPHLRRSTFISDLYECPPPLPVSHSLRCITVPTLNLSDISNCFPHARFLDIASFDQSVRPTLICPHLRILHLCVSLMKAIDACSLFNSSAFPSLKEMKLTGDIDRGTETTLLKVGESFFPLIYKLRKVTLHLNICGARMVTDPTQDEFWELIEIERERGNWEQWAIFTLPVWATNLARTWPTERYAISFSTFLRPVCSAIVSHVACPLIFYLFWCSLLFSPLSISLVVSLPSCLSAKMTMTIGWQQLISWRVR